MKICRNVRHQFVPLGLPNWAIIVLLLEGGLVLAMLLLVTVRLLGAQLWSV